MYFSSHTTLPMENTRTKQQEKINFKINCILNLIKKHDDDIQCKICICNRVFFDDLSTFYLTNVELNLACA